MIKIEGIRTLEKKGNHWHQIRNFPYKHLVFCNEYLSNGLNGKKAAEKAGYKFPAKEASVILKKPLVRKYIQKRLEKMEKEAGLTFDYKLKKLGKIIELCVDDAAQTFDDIKPQFAISAISECNKMQGHYAPDKSINQNVGEDKDITKTREIAEEEAIKQHERHF